MLIAVSSLATQEQRPPAAIQPIAPAELTKPAGDSGSGGGARPRFRVLHGLQLLEPTVEPRAWSCTAEEDMELLLRQRTSSSFNSSRATIGLLQLVHGTDERFLAEASTSRACIEQAFGETLPLTVAAAEGITCAFKQHGSPAEQECWASLMAAKHEAARSSPYDVTVLLDADMFANAGHPARQQVGATLRSLLTSEDVMLGAMEAPYREEISEVPLPLGKLNGGLLVYARAPASDRFFACTQQLMVRARREGWVMARPPGSTKANLTFNEQDAINWLLYPAAAGSNVVAESLGMRVPNAPPATMRSVTLRILPPSWMCRGVYPARAPVYLNPTEYNASAHSMASWRETGEGVERGTPCVFVHNHLADPRRPWAKLPPKEQLGQWCPTR